MGNLCDRITQQLGHFFLNIDNDVGFLQLFLQSLILTPQLFVFPGQRIALPPRTSLLRKSFANCSVAFLAPSVQRRRIDSFPPKHGADSAVSGSALDAPYIRFLSSALNLRRCALAGTSGSGKLAAKGTTILASLTMILLAALLCNYGRGFCLIDIGTEGRPIKT